MAGWHAAVDFIQSQRRAACLVLASLAQQMVKEAVRQRIVEEFKDKT